MARARTNRSAQAALQWVNLLLALIVLSIGLVVIVAGPAEAEQFATLHPLTGTVEVAEDGGEYREGREGQVLSAGDTVRTGPDGRAEIEYFDESLTRLDFDTTFTLEELSSDPDVPGSKTILTQQEEGRTFERVVALTDSESRFETETPTATASVRGTTFVLIENPDGTLSLWVLPDDDPEQGEVVLILADGSELLVVEGEGVVVFPDGTAGDPFPLTDEHLLDPWVLFNNCDLDELDLPACEEPEDPIDPIEPEDPEDPEEPDDGQPSPTPAAPSSFTSDGTTTTTTTGGGGDDGGPTDTTPPKTTITEAPPDLTRSRDATFRFRANEPIDFFQCSLDGGSYNRCSSGRTYTGLGDGTHQFRVRATDTSGNRENTATHQWTIDNEPPNTIIDSGPGANCFQADGQTICEGTNATFTFHATEAGSTFECRLEEEAEFRASGGTGTQPHDWQPCSSPRSYTGLQDFASYTFSVRATDRAGNTDPTPAEESWSTCGECTGGERRADRTEQLTQATAPPSSGSAVTGGTVDDIVSTIEDAVDDAVNQVPGAEGASDGAEEVLDLGDLLDGTAPRTADLPSR
jgi:hypothetical protein